MTQHCTVTSYRSLSSVARTLLPMAKKMHQEGIPWKRIAEDLEVSYSALLIWRKLDKEDEIMENREYRLDP